jgi:L-malate glycosyltransferase
LQQQVPSKLLLIGDGPERNSIEIACRESGACEHIRFLGKQEPIEEILSICDLFILPSEAESFGLAALEAMACQVPVISTNAGGLPELIEQGVTGFMSNVGDIDDMVKNAVFILADDKRLAQFKEHAAARAKKFDINLVMPLYEKLYMHVIDESKELVKT